ncbi:MAG: hypothetical protein US52_C0046G0003 [candidate division WS6 bacterium GW2011_GWA2_37_6]|uniref:Fibronectin type-III domain-containing protein n=1 Tax=candidate division WS6 bacterium GW2011_GWA2_37_6 TaxID=1619087 RepID=A0A0G0JDE5_9BACT|nr:MAG: hypothetical protein US52_C0046G0003 [candidate division WS6 bacterium GW2011_GWA2_37_6]
MRFTDSQGDIDLGLYNSVGTLLDSSAGTADNEYIDYTVSNAGNTYDLWWDDIALPVPPSAPALISPASGTSFTSTQQITLQWSATGNDYYGEILGGPNGTIYFDWQTGTSKNIGTQWPGTYQWHVKARNSGGTSGWSGTWTFTVQ